MFQLDDDFLQSVGLSSLPDDQKKTFLQDMYEELELRVGTRLAEGMAEEQFVAFEKLIEAGDDKGAIDWLEENRPNYREVVVEELEKLKQEVIAGKDTILATLASNHVGDNNTSVAA